MTGAGWELVTPRVARRRGTPETDLQRVMAGVLDTGPSSYVSHTSAAAHWGVPGFELFPLQVIVVRAGRQYPSDLATIHRPRHLPDPFSTVLDGVPVVRPALMALELCGTVHPLRAERALDAAWTRRLCSGASLRRELATLLVRGRTGTTLIRELLARRGDDYVPPSSSLEARFEWVLEKAGVPPLDRQVDAGDDTAWCGRVDYRDRDVPLVVEIDSERFHSALVDKEADAAREAALCRAGFLVVRLTEHQVWHRPHDVVAVVTDGRRRARRLRSA